LTTIGRKTGRPRSTPVTLVEKGDQRWLVAPYGPVSWVLNARAAGKVSIGRRGRAHDFTIEELSAEQAGPILQEYLKIAGATRPYFEATKASPVADFVAEASRHPVLELTAIADPQGTGGGAGQ
jgi:deazaflavin-dependent oxidoreductase (nitroreductase family)